MFSIKKLFSKIKECIKFENVIKFFSDKSVVGFLLFSIIVLIIGQSANIFAKNKFPFFTLYQLCLYIILIITFYSICFFEKKQNQFNTESAGDTLLFLIRLKTQKEKKAYKNTIFLFLIPTIIVFNVGILLNDFKLDIFMKIYCYIALWVIVAVSVCGYLSYWYCIKLAFYISKTSKHINIYNEYLPYNTNWLNTLSNMLYIGNFMFFVVGLLYVILFYSFSINNIFKINYEVILNQIIIIFFWCAIIFFIVICFPAYYLISKYFLKKIVTKLKQQKENTLMMLMGSLTHTPLIKQIYANVLMTLDSTPEHPSKPIFSVVVTIIIEIINLSASIDACIELFNIVKTSI